jgi:beta-N-acetylhexosaminidase
MNREGIKLEISLRDKIGQMLIVGFEGKKIEEKSPIVAQIEDYNLGGVILFDYNYQTKTFDKNIENPQQVRQLNQDLQYYAQRAHAQHHRPAVPLLISVDYEGGNVNRLKSTYGFPETIAAANVGYMSEQDTHKVASAMASTLRDAGFNLNYAPMLDVNVNPDNPIIGKLDRCFSKDPYQVAKYAEIYAHQFVAHGIQCVYKHFPGHGSASADSHLGFVDVTDFWQKDELIPYQALLQHNQGGMIMTAHIINRKLDASGLPATLSYPILTELLRHELKFTGVILSDDMQMKAISEHFGLEESLTLAINAGVDMFIFGNQLSCQPQDPKQVVDIIESNVISGKIKEARIDEAYQRIVTFKRSLSLESSKTKNFLDH